MDICPLSSWTLSEYRRELAGLMYVKYFDAMVVDGRNLVKCDRNCFKRDTSFCAEATMGVAMPIVCEYSRQYFFCRHTARSVWAGAVLLPPIAGRY